MEVRNNILLDSLLTLNTQNQRTDNAQQTNLAALKNKQQTLQKDTVNLSGEQRDNKNQFSRNPNQTFLVKERIEPLENGFRKLQEFESLNGRKFTRIEEVINSDDRSTRSVVQQSNSGNTTLFESILDRQEDGSFRLTQRFTDENGEKSTNILYDVVPDNTDFILGKPPTETSENKNLLQPSRGSALDINA